MTKVAWAHRKPLLLLAAAIGVVCLVVAYIGLADYWRVTGSDESMPDTKIVNSSVDEPSEKNPGNVRDEYNVPADQPRAIALPNLGVEAYVQRVGIDQGNAMATPNNIFFTGWYVGSVAPGEKGVSIINGHAGGRYNPGVFAHLKSLKSDEELRIQMGDLTWRKFKVVSAKSYSIADASKALFENDASIDEELHLITCDGVYDEPSQSYDRRVVVVAKRDDQ